MSLSRFIPARLRDGAGALRRRDFRNVFLAQSVSVFGDGITPVALTFAVLDLTGSGTDLGLVLAAQSVPLVLLALVGGVWADRLPRAALMMASDLVRAAVQITGAVLLLTGTAQIWQLAVLAACHGAAEAFFRPAAGAILPQIVPAGELQQANALMGISDNFGWMVGPAVAGVLVAVIGRRRRDRHRRRDLPRQRRLPRQTARAGGRRRPRPRSTASSRSCAPGGARSSRAPGSG